MPNRRKVTLADVAQRAGVAPATASYILNGRAPEMRISAEAEARVRQAVADLRYRPNRSARTLRLGEGKNASRTIAVVSDHLAGGAFASRMLDGARDAAREHDHLLVIGETGGDTSFTVRVIEEMLDRQVDGIVYATLVTGAVLAPPVLRQTSSVLLNCVDPGSELSSVLPDERGGGICAADHVLSTIGPSPTTTEVWLVGDDQDGSGLAGPLRQEGLCSRLRSAGVHVQGVIPAAWDVVSAYEAATSWLKAHSVVAGELYLVCFNDRIAMGVYQALAERGLHVPTDVQVVSFDGSEMASWLRPSLTSVAVPYYQMGELAVRLLLDSTPGSDSILRVPMSVQVGSSTARIAAGLTTTNAATGP